MQFVIAPLRRKASYARERIQAEIADVLQFANASDFRGLAYLTGARCEKREPLSGSKLNVELLELFRLQLGRLGPFNQRRPI
jgi:hypothetical protein